MNSERQEAIDRIAELARQHGISQEEIAERLEGGPMASSQGPTSSRLTMLLAYLGGIFVFSGLVTLTNMVWPDLSSAARVAITLGSGVILLVLALVADRDERFRRASLPLYLMAAVLQPAGLFVLLHEYSTGGDAALGSAAVFGAMSLQSALLFAQLRWTRTVLFTVIYGVATFSSLMAWLDVSWEFTTLVVSISGLLVTIGIRQGEHRVLCPLLYPIFAFALACAAFDILHGEFPVDFGLLAVGAALVVLSTGLRSRSLLVASVIITLAYLGYYTNEYFADMMGWPIALIVMGMVMIGLSSYAVRLGRQIR